MKVIYSILIKKVYEIGKGGWGPLGPCTFMSAHWEKPCPCCNGFKQTWRSKKCLLCKGRGGLGSLGPTEIGDIHFLKECDVCGGAGFVR